MSTETGTARGTPPRWFVRATGAVVAFVVLLVLGPLLSLYAGFCWRLFMVGTGR